MLSKNHLTYLSIHHIHAKVCRNVNITFSTIIDARAGTIFMQIPSCKVLGSEVKKVEKLKTYSFFSQTWQYFVLYFCKSGNVLVVFSDEFRNK
jgi:hypothetical protein